MDPRQPCRRSGILTAVLAAALVVGPAVAARAQSHGGAPTQLATPSALQQAASGTAAAKRGSFLTRAKAANLDLYVACYSTAMGVFAGFVISLLSYRFSAGGRIYRAVKARMLLWSAALGLGVGLLVAVLQVPSIKQGEPRLLIPSLIAGTVATPLVTAILYPLFRAIHRWRRGWPRSERMDLM